MSVCTENPTSAFVSTLMQPGQSDIWTSIQARKSKQLETPKQEPYIHPLIRQSSSLLSQKSLETCTESLGSETGSNDFFSSDDELDFLSKAKEIKQDLDQRNECGFKKLSTVNYHCSISRRSSTPRSFPPPLTSISQQDGPCVQMRPHRKDGRLVVEAFTVPSQNYLHAERHNGRLLLSFINTTSTKNLNSETPIEAQVQEQEQEQEQEQAEEMEAVEEEEEEVEVVDRGTIVEVKVSTQPQQTSMKVHRSSIVINKFVSCTPVENVIKVDQECSPPVSPSTKRSSATRTTAAAAAVAASSVSVNVSADSGYSSTDNKLLFASKRKNKEELLHDMKRCSELKKPLFIWEPCYIAAST